METSDRGQVYLVDDNTDVRHHIGTLLRHLGYAVETFGDPRLFLCAVSTLRWPAAVVLDMRMPGINGLGLQVRLRELELACGIVFISGESEPPEIVQAMKRGAVDFLFKPITAEQLEQAIDTALERAATLETAYAGATRIRQGIVHLSPRETEVLSLMIEGHQNRDIAARLDIQAGTVKKHRAAICDKFGVESTSEVIALFHQAGPIAPLPAVQPASGNLISMHAPLPSASAQLPTLS